LYETTLKKEFPADGDEETREANGTGKTVGVNLVPIKAIPPFQYLETFAK